MPTTGEQKPYIPIYARANWVCRWRAHRCRQILPSRFLVDKTIEFIDSNGADRQPFCLSALPGGAYSVQAPREFTDQYMGVYDAGWDVLRERRRDRARQLGIVPADANMVRMSTTDNWESYSPEMRRYHAKRSGVRGHGGCHGPPPQAARAAPEGYRALPRIRFSSSPPTMAPEGQRRDDVRSLLMRLSLRYSDYNDPRHPGTQGQFQHHRTELASAVGPLAYFSLLPVRRRACLDCRRRIPCPRGPVDQQRLLWVTDITPTILDVPASMPRRGHYGGRRVEPHDSRRSLLP